MSVIDIVTIINFFILLGIASYIYAVNKYLDKNNIVNYVSEIFKISRANLKQDLYTFLQEVTKKYSNHQNEILKLLKEQQKEVEKLKHAILTEANVFKEYCEERVKVQRELIETTEKRLKDAQKQIAKLENMLSKCRKKIERLKNENNKTS